MILKYKDFINESTIFSGINLETEFNYLNKELYDNELPMIPLKWNNSKDVMGSFRYFYKKVKGQRVIAYEEKHSIEISKFFTFTLERIRDVLAHEMLHYWFFYKRITMKDPHGPVFYGKMQELNKKGIVKMSIYDETPLEDLEITKKDPLKTPVRLIRLTSKDIKSGKLLSDIIGLCTKKCLNTETIDLITSGLKRVKQYEKSEVELIIYESTHYGLKLIPTQTKLSNGVFSLKTYSISNFYKVSPYAEEILKDSEILRKSTTIH